MRRSATLPVAQRQIVAICRGLAANARLLFMDEPTASLTRHEVDLLLATVRRLKALGVAVVFVSHRLEEVVEIAERVTVLRDGRKVGTFPASEVDDHRLAELMTGNRIEHTVTGAAHSTDASPFWSCAAPRAPASSRMSPSPCTRGEVLGLTGLLGAGRTELALALFGMSGSIAARCSLEWQACAASLQPGRRSPPASPMCPRIGSSLGVNLRQSIADNISIAVLDRLVGSAGLVSPGDRSRNWRQSWVERLDIKSGDRSTRRCKRCPAATSSASSSPNGWRPSPRS